MLCDFDPSLAVPCIWGTLAHSLPLTSFSHSGKAWLTPLTSPGSSWSPRLVRNLSFGLPEHSKPTEHIFISHTVIYSTESLLYQVYDIAVNEADENPCLGICADPTELPNPAGAGLCPF